MLPARTIRLRSLSQARCRRTTLGKFTSTVTRISNSNTSSRSLSTSQSSKGPINLNRPRKPRRPKKPSALPEKSNTNALPEGLSSVLQELAERLTSSPRLRDNASFLSLDVGTDKTGFALTSASRDIVFPLKTIDFGFANPTGFWRELRPVLAEHRVFGVVVGLPLDPETGDIGAQAEKVIALVEHLSRALKRDHKNSSATKASVSTGTKSHFQSVSSSVTNRSSGPLPVMPDFYFWDERWTSHDARVEMWNENRVKLSRQLRVEDQRAAILILRGFLESLNAHMSALEAKMD